MDTVYIAHVNPARDKCQTLYDPFTDDTMKADNMPRRGTKGSAGYDFYSPDVYNLIPGTWTTIDTGVRLTDEDVLDGNDEKIRQWFMMVVPRSGLSNRYGFRIRNTVGIIDMDYRETIKVKVTVDMPYILEKGERFLQGILIPFGRFAGEIVPTAQRIGGFGSTGRM